MRNIMPWKKKEEGMEKMMRHENPFDMFHRKMENLLDDFFGDFGTQLPALSRFGKMAGGVSPKFEVAETDSEFLVSAELPGLDEKDLSVAIDENSLTVKGEKKEEHEEKKKNYFYSERNYGEFQRVIPLPQGIDTEKIRASFKKGVLEISLPKTEKAKSEKKQIKINVE